MELSSWEGARQRMWSEETCSSFHQQHPPPLIPVCLSRISSTLKVVTSTVSLKQNLYLFATARASNTLHGVASAAASMLRNLSNPPPLSAELLLALVEMRSGFAHSFD